MRIQGCFSKKGIYHGFDINDLELKIILQNSKHEAIDFAHMRIKSAEIIGEKFIWNLESVSINLKNHQINKFYSKSCRVSFCGKECGLLLEKYSHIFLAYRVRNHYIDVDKVLESSFLGGDAIFSGNSKFQAKIMKIDGNILTLDREVPSEKFDYLKLVVECDKSFESCCNIFDNAINFRGEPHIPEDDKFMVG